MDVCRSCRQKQYPVLGSAASASGECGTQCEIEKEIQSYSRGRRLTKNKRGAEKAAWVTPGADGVRGAGQFGTPLSPQPPK